jgi:ABC-type Fe3+/spermidine/putrescine transport system ATPase subunit
MTRLTINALSRQYAPGHTPAVSDVSFTVEPGELFALLGPSGSGKSTILKLIAGIEPPDAGDIRFDEKSILPVAAHRRGAVLMFQRAYLFPYLSVADNIGFGLKMQRVPRERIRAEVQRMLDLVELPDYGGRKPSQLSGGEQQRIALARALVTRPRLLMLDEPLSSLDPGVRQTLQESIRRIQRELGLTTLLVTHDLAEAFAMADRVAILQNGQLVACDQPRRLYERPPNRSAARFVGITTLLTGRLIGSTLHSPMGALQTVSNGLERDTTFAIRPEQIRLHEQPGPNRVCGTLIDSTYRGDSSEYRVRAGDELLRVRTESHCPLRPGTMVYLEFPPEHLFELE